MLYTLWVGSIEGICRLSKKGFKLKFTKENLMSQMKLKNIIILIISCFISLSSFAQLNKSLLINSWKAIKYEEANGEQFSPPKEMKNDFIKFNSNGTYESLESGKLLIKGNWTLNDKTKILSLIQHISKNYHTLIKLRIIKLTKN